MARIRTLKPEFWAHPKVAGVSLQARLLFIGLITEADDAGRLYGSPRKLLGAIFPHDGSVSEKQVGRWLGELTKAGLAKPYEAESVSYLCLPGFNDHQKISHPTPSRLPSPSGIPPEDHTSSNGDAPEDSASDSTTIKEGIKDQGSSSSSSSDSRGIGSNGGEEEIWRLVAERRLVQAKATGREIPYPEAWVRTAAKNARNELAERFAELDARFVLEPAQMADALNGNTNVLKAATRR